MGFGISSVGDFVSQAFEPVRKISQKIIPKEIRPALPFLAAATPFMLPGQGFGPGAGIFSGTRGRALLSTLANLGAQAAADPEGEDISLLSAGLAGLQGLGTTQGFGDTLRDMTTKGQLGIMPDGLIQEALGNRGFFTKAADLGLTGLAKGADLLSGTRETLGSIGKGAEAGGIDLFSKEGAKAAGKALALPTAQGVGDLGYTTATAALRDFQKAEAEELAAAGADEAAIANARRAAIREAMEVSGFGEEDILDTFDEIGLKDGGIASLKDGGMLDFDGREMDLRGGGFVPIGKKEKADDVPARLSKNEFVMTADAVRAAGGGSVNEGAKRMYKVMNDLEARA